MHAKQKLQKHTLSSIVRRGSAGVRFENLATVTAPMVTAVEFANFCKALFVTNAASHHDVRRLSSVNSVVSVVHMHNAHTA